MKSLSAALILGSLAGESLTMQIQAMPNVPQSIALDQNTHAHEVRDPAAINADVNADTILPAFCPA